MAFKSQNLNSNTTLVKVKFGKWWNRYNTGIIQIQHLLKLNEVKKLYSMELNYSNTTLVKVKLFSAIYNNNVHFHSNTTLVKVKS